MSRSKLEKKTKYVVKLKQEIVKKDDEKIFHYLIKDIFEIIYCSKKILRFGGVRNST